MAKPLVDGTLATLQGPCQGALHMHCGTRQQPARGSYPARFRWKMRKNWYGILPYHCRIPIKHCRTYSFIRRTERIDAAVAQSPVKRCRAPPIAMRISDRPLKYVGALGTKYRDLLLYVYEAH